MDRRQVASLSIKAERSRRFALLASLAFANFLALYRKYDPDQPRDERGRWTETGEDENVHLAGATVVRRYRIGDPKIDDVSSVLEQKVVEAMDAVGPGSGPRYGTAVHGTFAMSVIAEDIPGIRSHGVEVSFVAGETVPYVADESIRTDVILRAGDGRSDPVIGIWDLKTGSAILGPSRAEEIRRQVGVGPEVPVIELHSIRGISVKEMDGIIFRSLIASPIS